MTAATAEKLELTVQDRTVKGQKVNKLRAEGLVPAVVYGKGMEPKSVQIPVDDLDDIYGKAGESTLVYLNMGSESVPTIIAEVTRHPVSGAYVHADFQKVRLDEKVAAEVPLVYVGESPAVKSLGGILVKNVTEIEVEALPQNLPHEIEVDISGLANFDDHIAIKDLKLADAEVISHEVDDIIALIQEPKSQEELDAELAEPAVDVSAVEGAEPAEGEEAPAEGEEKKEEAPAEEKPE